MFEAFRCQAPPLRAAAARAASSLPEQTAASAAATPPRAAKKRRTQGSGGGVAAPPPAAAQQPAGLALEKMGDRPLRLVIVGHNPSEHAWSSGHFYSNPSNWMWRILRDTGIAPAAIRGAEDDGRLPEVAGVGFTDVGSGNPGTDSSQFGAAHFAAWRPGFFGRLEAQARRAGAAVGCTCGGCGAPAVVAFSGKRQFQELFASGGGAGGRGRQKKAAGAAAGGSPLGSPQQAVEAAADAAAGAEAPPPAAAAGGEQPSSHADGSSSSSAAGSSLASTERLPVLQARRPASIATGRQWVLPEGWPLPLTTEVWVMTSTSGAAPMTREQRYAPWQALAERLANEPWPRQCQLRCRGSADG